jgi:hypothetical protein
MSAPPRGPVLVTVKVAVIASPPVTLRCLKVIGNRPDGLTLPASISAIAWPPA